ncbi:hypothetical protein SAMN05444280_10445 [Tangfeifania diversioriginum]|uniref:Uncharacterized protein n=1 Tax=Tangfeifania diversioriginum TaxID=1168035 RepID=A0A1M6CPC3_9BACT|nr:hypothetical protein [Tangfeifania diversioriginum]SHI62866.1 hypothetical protein SAMN05444280_10445 [Tangfeifania diversioriginum]
MDLFDGLLLYEITLLLLGVILFLILSAGLLYYIIKKEQIKKLLLFFVIPIVMIGYPSIKEITISKDRIAFRKHLEEYIENPADSTSRRKVELYTEKLEKRATDSEDIMEVSKSNLLLGNPEKAVTLADKALQKDNTNQEARDIKRLAETQLQVNRNVSAMAQEEEAEQEEPEQEATLSESGNTQIAEPASNLNNLQITGELSEEAIKPVVSQNNLKVKSLQNVEVTQKLSNVKSFLLKKAAADTVSAK